MRRRPLPTFGVAAVVVAGRVAKMESSTEIAPATTGGGAGNPSVPVIGAGGDSTTSDSGAIARNLGASGGSPSTSTAAASSAPARGPGDELPKPGSFMHIHGSDAGAMPSGAGGAITGGTAGSGPREGSAGGTPGATGDGPPGSLRGTPPGSAVVLDPNDVYVVGYVSDLNHYDGPYGIAPLAHPDDAVTGIPLFSSVFVRTSDGHLLYDWLGAEVQSSAVITPLYDFHRDDGTGMELTAGEPVVSDGAALCEIAPRGSFGIENAPAAYAISVDDSVYHACILDQATSDGTMVWFGARSSTQGYTGIHPFAFAVQGRGLGELDDGSLVVFDAETGAHLATHSDTELFGNGFGAVAVRPRGDGFWVAGGSGPDGALVTVNYVDLDLTGQVVARGDYAALPVEASVDAPGLSSKSPVIDGHGTFYQFATAGDDTLVVRRPMAGPSTVVYRASNWPSSSPHTVLVDYLVSGPNAPL
jgi:hypothetical protein